MRSNLAIHEMDAELVDTVAEYVAKIGKTIEPSHLMALYGLEELQADRILSDPRFTAKVNALVEISLFRDGKRAAVNFLVSTVQNGGNSIPHRLRAAELILSRTMAAATAPVSDPSEKDLAELSVDDLRAMVDSIQDQLSDRAAPINTTHAPKHIDGSVIDPNNCLD